MNFGNVGTTDILNLKKDNILDLTKTGSSLKHLILGADGMYLQLGQAMIWILQHFCCMKTEES